MYDKNANEITNINACSKGFDFLADEPELYSLSDLKKVYVSGAVAFSLKKLYAVGY